MLMNASASRFRREPQSQARRAPRSSGGNAMLRYALIALAAFVLVCASLVPDDALARRGGGVRAGGFHGGGARAAHFRGGAVHAGRIGGVAGRGYGYRPPFSNVRRRLSAISLRECPQSELGDWWPIRKSPPLAGLSASIRGSFSERRTAWLGREVSNSELVNPVTSSQSVA
jgi:hypothetical protein